MLVYVVVFFVETAPKLPRSKVLQFIQLGPS